MRDGHDTCRVGPHPHTTSINDAASTRVFHLLGEDHVGCLGGRGRPTALHSSVITPAHNGTSTGPPGTQDELVVLEAASAARATVPLVIPNLGSLLRGSLPPSERQPKPGRCYAPAPGVLPLRRNAARTRDTWMSSRTSASGLQATSAKMPRSGSSGSRPTAGACSAVTATR